jgi:hypothetical protein
MSFLDDDDTFSELADEERRRKGRRRSFASSSAVKALLLLLVVVVVVAIGGMLIRDWLHNREVSSYAGYVDQVTSILKDSDKAGAELTATRPSCSAPRPIFVKPSSGSLPPCSCAPAASRISSPRC